MKKTIIKASEVVQLATVDPNLAHQLFNKKIFAAEFDALWRPNTGLLGKECYKLMLADLIDSSCYNEETEYQVGDYVELEGVNYESLAINLGVYPIGSSNWREAGKFQTEAWQDLWDNGIGSYLANSVIYRAYPAIRVQLDNQGATRKKGDTYDAADRHDAAITRETFNEEAESYRELAMEFLKENRADYTCFKFTDDCGCETKQDPVGENLGIFLDNGNT